jgi:hypothetical protein
MGFIIKIITIKFLISNFIVMSKKYIFSESDYNSGDGMMTSVWGPPMWHVLHTISFNYPLKPTNEQKIFYYNFYTNLKNILTCK